MESVTFCNTDTMPMIGLGTWKSKPNEVYKAVKEALRTGYRHIDCAMIYGNEKEVGKALTESFDEGIITREDIWITSKLWNSDHKKEDVKGALLSTLEDLRLDYLDLYLMHWPVVLKPGVLFPETVNEYMTPAQVPLAETWKAMASCRETGLTRHIGVSNFSIKKLKDLTSESGITPEMNQIELHPFLQQENMLSYCQANGIFLTAYAPLGSGDRPDVLKTENETGVLEHPVILRIAREKNCSPAQVLIRWAMNRGTVVIPKSVNPARIRENLQAAHVELSAKDMADIAALDSHSRYLRGNRWTGAGSPYTMKNLWDE